MYRLIERTFFNYSWLEITHVLFFPSASHWEPRRPQKGFTQIKMRESLHLSVIQIHTQKHLVFIKAFFFI